MLRRLVQARTFASLRNHYNYRLYYLGQVVSVSGSWMQDIALPWLTYDLTHSATAVGFVVFCRTAPMLVFGLFSGVIADRFDNRRVFMFSQLFQFFPAAALAVLSLSGNVQLWQVFVLALVGGCALPIEAPTRQTLIYQLVGREELPNAVALHASIVNVGRIAGPGLGGIVIAVAGVGWCFAINAVSFLVVFAAVFAMRAREMYPVERAAKPPTVFGGFREAIGFLRVVPAVAVVIVLTLVLGASGFNTRVMVPVLATKGLGVTSEVFGLLYGVFSVGALAGALLTATRGRARVRSVLIGTGILSVAFLGLARVSTVPPAMAMLLCAGVGSAMWVANASAFVQLAAPDQLRGRVAGLMVFAFHAAQPIGGLVSGFLADRFGTEVAFTVTGVVAGTATLAAAGTMRRLRATARTQAAAATSGAAP